MDDEEDIPTPPDDTDWQQYADNADEEQIAPRDADFSAPPPIAPRVPNLILSGPQGPAPAPMVAPPPAAMQSPEVAASREMIRRLQYRYNGAPVEEAEKGVALALRFQALRQYQNDLAKGIDPATALAKSAPLMFGGGRQANLGQAGTFIKNITPGEAKIHNAEGILYRQNPDGTITQLTQGTRGGHNSFDLAEYHSILSQIAKVQHDSAADDPRSPIFRTHLSQLQALQSQADRLRNRVAGATATVVPRGAIPNPGLPAITAPPQARVRVVGPGGKRGTVPAGTALPAGWKLQ